MVDDSQVRKVCHDNGTVTFVNNFGRFHRMDGPAVIYPDGSEEWYLNGEPHRTGGPAVIWGDGRESYYFDGELHRVDGPAVISVEGFEAWWVDGQLVRVVDAEGDQ